MTAIAPRERRTFAPWIAAALVVAAAAYVPCAAAVAPGSPGAAGDEAPTYVFELATNGQIRGAWLNPTRRPEEPYQVRTLFGATITLEKQCVERCYREPPRQAEYERIRPTFPDTPEGQYALAEWCRDNFLSAARKKHLERVIELDPNHEAARRALGYTWRKEEQRWVTQEQIMEERGYVRYGPEGRWMLPQAVELEEQRRKTELAEIQWIRDLGRWRKQVDRRPWSESRAYVLAIASPYAVKAMQRYLDPKFEPNAEVRRLFAEALVQIGTPGAISAVIRSSLHDPHEDVRYTCVEVLAQRPHPDIVKQYIPYLVDDNPVIINRAAFALEHQGDPSAVGPLIDALVSTHQVQYTSGGSGYTTTFSSSGSSFQTGPSTRSYTHTSKNTMVRNALVRLTGENFDYDVPRWRAWYASQKKLESVDLRRD